LLQYSHGITVFIFTYVAGSSTFKTMLSEEYRGNFYLWMG